MRYTDSILMALSHMWWDVVLQGDSSWMDAHNGYLYVSVYLAAVGSAVSAYKVIAASSYA